MDEIATWGQFKAWLEQHGVKDEERISLIEVWRPTLKGDVSLSRDFEDGAIIVEDA
jgi:hypothetical protein